MTEKRFQWVFIKDNELELRDNGIVKRFNNERLEELLNGLHEENRELQRHLDVMRSDALTDDKRIKELYDESEQLKKALLFFYDVANCECSTNWKGDMEKGCKRFFNCTYEEAKEKYGNYDGMWWEIND